MNGFILLHSKSGSLLFSKQYQPNFGFPLEHSSFNDPNVLAPFLFALYLNVSNAKPDNANCIQEVSYFESAGNAMHFEIDKKENVLCVVFSKLKIEKECSERITRELLKEYLKAKAVSKKLNFSKVVKEIVEAHLAWMGARVIEDLNSPGWFMLVYSDSLTRSIDGYNLDDLLHNINVELIPKPISFEQFEASEDTTFPFKAERERRYSDSWFSCMKANTNPELDIFSCRRLYKKQPFGYVCNSASSINDIYKSSDPVSDISENSCNMLLKMIVATGGFMSCSDIQDSFKMMQLTLSTKTNIGVVKTLISVHRIGSFMFIAPVSRLDQKLKLKHEELHSLSTFAGFMHENGFL